MQPPVATPALAVMAVAIASRLPSLGAYWNQDDWGLLARAAGLVPGPAEPFRWLSQTAYWQLLWPLAGLDTAPYAVTRLILHALAAAGVVRLACRLGLAPARQWIAGLVFAATPLAFGPLYWAAGVQDLLAVCGLVWSLERWLAPGRGARFAAAALALAALAAKEVVLGLPLLLAWLLWRDRRERKRPGPWLLVVLVAAAAAAALALALRFFATGPADPYAFGGAATILGNLLVYGSWLLLPGPSHPPSPGVPLALAGGVLWLAWAFWSRRRARQGFTVPAFALLGALLMLAPLLPLRHHIGPDLAYPVEPFGCLALACLWPDRRRPRTWLLAVLVLTSAAWGFAGMRGRLSLRDEGGAPADPLVRRTAVSAAAARDLRQLPPGIGALVFLQPPWTRRTADMAAELGEQWVTGSTLYHALDGPLGPRLLLGGEREVIWANGLRRTPERAFVLLDRDLQLVPWGQTRQALLYLTLTDLGLGLFERARAHLLRASLLSGPALGFAFDPRALAVPLERAVANLPGFLDHLDRSREAGRPPDEIGGLRANILNLLSVCTGRAPHDLATVATPGEDPGAKE